ELPFAFALSTIVMVLSSFTYYFALAAIRKDDRSKTSMFLWITFVLGVTFVFLQFKGFGQVIDNGFYFTGPESNVTTSFLYIVVIMHIAHLSAGLISLLIVIYNHYK